MRITPPTTRRETARRAAGSSPSAEPTYLERINLTIDHIHEHWRKPVRLRSLARVACLSPFHFHRVFQALVGETPAQFALRLRLEKAVGMMALGNRRTLGEIAAACGFNSSSDFSRAFKRRFGVSPRAFDLQAWQAERGHRLDASIGAFAGLQRVVRLPPRDNPSDFSVQLRELPARTVAYIRVERPYQGDRVVRAYARLMRWAELRGLADGQWLGYQWENPEITDVSACHYYAAVVVPSGSDIRHQLPRGEIGLQRFPSTLIAQIDIDGGIDLELQALRWLYGVWLPRSRYVPADQPGFEAWNGRPFALGYDRFRLAIQLPIKAYR